MNFRHLIPTFFLTLPLLLAPSTRADDANSAPTPHQEDRYRGRQDERTGNRTAPDHEPAPTPTPASTAPLGPG